MYLKDINLSVKKFTDFKTRLTILNFINFKCNIGLETLLQQGILEPVYYCDFAYKFQRIVGKPSFSDQFNKIIKRYKREGYNMDHLRKDVWMIQCRELYR